MRNSQMLSRIALALVAAAAGIVSFYIDRDEQPDPNLKCSFVAQRDGEARPAADPVASIEKVGVGGYLSATSEEQLFDFEGRAKLASGDMTRSLVARGYVFLWEPGQVGDLSITLEPEPYADRIATLITFDKNGSLSERANTAFAFDNPDLKLAHPMTYRCTLIGPLPKAEA